MGYRIPEETMAPKTMQGSLVLAFMAGSVGRKD